MSRAVGMVSALMLALGLAMVGASVWPAHAMRPAALPLIPILPGLSRSPEFRATFLNDADRDVDLAKSLHASSLILDGREIRRGLVKFGGRSNLRPGESWSFDISPAEYLLGEALRPGRHTVVLRFGGKEFGPSEFLWQPPAREPAGE